MIAGSMLVCTAGFAKIPRDTMLLLNEVRVMGVSLGNFSSGSRIEPLKPSVIANYQASSLGDLLLQNSSLGVNSYGYGGLSTVSMRGAGANHTAVLWNGFNIQNSLNGGLNFALVPVFFVDNITIQYGGCSALFGSGAVGGIIHLNQTPEYNKGTTLYIDGSLGSFGFRQTGAKVQFSNNRYSGGVRLFYRAAENNFMFRNTSEFNAPMQIQKNAGLNSQGLLLDNAFRINARQQLISHIWVQDNFNQIPSPMTVSSDSGRQTNRDIRGTLEWQYTGESAEYAVRTACFNELMNYASLSENGRHNAITYVGEAEGRYKLGSRHVFRYGTNYTLEQGISNYFSQKNERERIAAFASYKLFSKSHSSSLMLNVREEYIDSKSTPLTFSMGMNHNTQGHFSFKASVARSYRVPTFNELFWTLWGNPDLKPEQGLSEDAGYSCSFRSEHQSLKFNQTLYNSNISNWIIWQPQGSLWHPFNIEKVWSRGIENEIEHTYSSGDWKFETGIKYAINYATKMKAESVNAETVGKQLIYVPRHKMAVHLSASFKGYQLMYSQTITGKRYTVADNSQYVDAYTLSNVSFSKEFIISKMKARLNFNIYNLWNTSYQVMAWYAMPGRNYQLGLAFTVN